MKLRWKLNDKQTGISRVCAGPRGSKYHDGDEYYASVSCSKDGKWFWSAPSNSRLGIEWKNSAAEGIYFDTSKEAKIYAKKYIDGFLK